MSITIAVIGCGRIAKYAHFPALSKIEGLRVKYACDIIEEKAVQAKNEFPIIENVITDYKVALADEEVEAVFVLTPNYKHYEITMDALRAGKHVMCEKPITVNYELSCEMADMAKKCDRILNIGVCNRHNRSVELLEQYNREGKFGKIYHVCCSFRGVRSIPGLGGAFTTKAESGGGVLIDWGVHFLDIILYVLGGAKIKDVICDDYCALAKDMKSYKYHNMWAEETKNVETGVCDVDDFISGYVRTDKANITLTGAWAQNIDKVEMYIDFLGDKGGARLDYGGKFEFFDGQTLETVVPEYDIPDHYLEETLAFIDSVKTGKHTRNYIDNILETMKLLDMLYASSDENKGEK